MRSLALILCSVALFAQKTPEQMPFQSTGDPRLEGRGIPVFPQRSYFDFVFDKQQAKVELQSPIKLEDYVVGDRIELRLKDYLDLVLQNNTDVLISRVNLEIPRNNVLRSFGVFDPVVSGNIQASRSNTPTINSLEGAQALSTLTQPLNLRWGQTLATGASAFSTYNVTRTSSNNAFLNFNPAFNNGLGFGVTQPLLRDRGLFITRIPIMIAKSNLRAQEYNFENRVLNLIADAETLYWNVVSARENLRVQEQALQFAGEALKRAKRELEIGAISPLDIFQPEQNYATIDIQVTRARYDLQAAEDQLRRQISLDLNTQLRGLPIVLTEQIGVPGMESASYDREELVNKALRARPDLRSARQLLDIDQLQIQAAQNRLRPSLNLNLNYSLTGRGGRQLLNNGTVVSGGYGDALSQMFGFGFPTYTAGISFAIPLRDRRAAADLSDARVAQKLDAYNVRNVEQQIRLGILNAVTQVESSRASVRLANVALDFARKRLEAEQKKYDLGTTTIFFLLAAQNDLTQAQAALVNSQIQYRRDLLLLDRRTGDLLQQRNLVLQ